VGNVVSFVENFIRFSAVQKFWKSVKIWQSGREFKGGNFFWDTVYKCTKFDENIFIYNQDMAKNWNSRWRPPPC